MHIDTSIAARRESFLGFLAQRVPLSADRHQSTAGNPSAVIEQIWRRGEVASHDIAEAVSAYFELPRLRFDQVHAHAAAGGDLSLRYLRDAFVFPFDRDGDLSAVVADPMRADVISAVEVALERKLTLYIATFDDIELLFERSAAQAAPSADLEPAVRAPSLSLNDVDSLQDLARGAPVVRQIDELLERAIELSATDVHLETEREQLRVRLRIDGILRTHQRLPLAMAPAVISRIKIIAGLDIAERRLPQDGRANVRVGAGEADLRVAIMPTIHGETAVIRILVQDSRMLEMTRLGMSPADQRAFQALLAEPHGVVIITGPTGSGKTTSLATAIAALNEPGRKIVTVEDPIEYQLPGVAQTQVKPAIGLTFATALRSFLRHDPDIIMVGEMRDRETASIGVQAALTGHLVLTTLHTNSAADAVIRLADMGIEPYLIGASLRGVVGQRLVRRLCERCRRPDPAPGSMVIEAAAARGISLSAQTTFFAAGGCDACGHTGYRGRVGIFEVMRLDHALTTLIRQQSDSHLMVSAAREKGMTTMLEDGMSKCSQGLTSLEEVFRAMA